MSRILVTLALVAAVSAEDWTNCNGDIQTCLQMQLASLLGRAARAPSIPIAPGIELARTAPPAQEKEEDFSSLPRSLDDKSAALDEVIASKITDMLSTHSIQLRLNEFVPQEEGRGRRRRTMTALLLMFLMTAGTVIPIKLGALALLAGKALIVAKLALALAAIVGLKKLLSSHDDHESYQVVHGHRSLDDNVAAHDMAYSAQKPQ